MVTFRQVARSYISAVKAADRNQKRRAREAARIYKEKQKLQEVLDAANAVRQYEEYIDVLLSIHKKCIDKINWQKIQDDPEPPKPKREMVHEKVAQQKLDYFKPSFFDKIFGTKRKIAALKRGVEDAKVKDNIDFETSTEIYEDWLKLQAIAKGIQFKEKQAYIDALNYFDLFGDISDLGSRIKIHFDNDILEVEFIVKSTEVLPNFIISQTKTGKLSQREMPKSKFNKLYQDYVCGGLLRIAREVFACLPIEIIGVHALAEMVNPVTGHLEEVPIVSALLPLKTMKGLNFEMLDPSESLQNFLHNMNFSKIDGFRSVERVKI